MLNKALVTVSANYNGFQLKTLLFSLHAAVVVIIATGIRENNIMEIDKGNLLTCDNGQTSRLTFSSFL